MKIKKKCYFYKKQLTKSTKRATLGSKSIELEMVKMYSMAVELINSINSLSDFDKIKKDISKTEYSLAKLDGILDEEGKILDDMNERLTPFLKETYPLMINESITHQLEGLYVIVTAFQCQTDNFTLAGFFKWLDDLSVSRARLIYSSLFMEISEEDLSNTNLVKAKVKESKGSKTNKKTFLDLYENSEARLNTLKTFVKEFYEVVFKPFAQVIEERVSRINEEFEKNLKTFGSKDLGINTREWLDGTYIISYINPVEYWIYSDRRRLILGHRRFDKTANYRVYSMPVKDILKILSDSTRFKMMELFKVKMRCAKDIIEELGLAKSTVSYQINILLNLEVFDFDFYDGYQYYKVNMKRYEELLEKLKMDLLKN